MMISTTKAVKPSDILRKAASIINSDMTKGIHHRAGCCDAIARAAEVLCFNGPYTEELKATKYLTSLFKPHEYCSSSYWFDRYETDRFSKKEQEHRIIALLMTADMAESVNE